MARFSIAALSVLVLSIRQCAAHFLLNYPPTIGFDDSLETTPPCGSFTVDFSTDNVTDFHVGGNAIAVTSIHPQATWLFRATLDITAAGNWTALLPAVQQTGLGDFCEPVVTVPASWAGKKGVIGVVQDAPDGILYQVRSSASPLVSRTCLDHILTLEQQCAAVNFVTGTQPAPSSCKNVTGLTATFTTDASLSSLPAGPTSSASTTTAATTSTSPSPSAKSGAVSTTSSYSGIGAIVWLSMVFLATIGVLLL
ncbi:copper acquisition factor BIM1-like domain-containing protein [Aspergillus thermomutatus]|uniref:Copper acquisition factor BIM1-like domain-containing protein n=1 Tax=Aspergillus thermomutatus TaxID=41047 RepID=A0A397HPM9_ASPTH|nr:uncharacterized protein CDV56_100700 [Aspergillus thermomutatus]RHZ64897.1 hypothetical protein CDV56_100700 [Aspergillus thermomutatus]